MDNPTNQALKSTVVEGEAPGDGSFALFDVHELAGAWQAIGDLSRQSVTSDSIAGFAARTDPPPTLS